MKKAIIVILLLIINTVCYGQDKVIVHEESIMQAAIDHCSDELNKSISEKAGRGTVGLFIIQMGKADAYFSWCRDTVTKILIKKVQSKMDSELTE